MHDDNAFLATNYGRFFTAQIAPEIRNNTLEVELNFQPMPSPLLFLFLASLSLSQNAQNNFLEEELFDSSEEEQASSGPPMK